ncbi:hypothetical protein BIU82_09860 [Arthrobacter sp. SW1]|uniref:hypothetical protein n=1 Tax=Arthrobacter sp. SW1 TaxID=1920889 RepID=UPI000877D659|nr:hypothetical protein [Arthrobacter sp. SW1]OFI37362.1 hypothetical protein BIU82_09860 [Arthrobacter sp. SW1]
MVRKRMSAAVAGLVLAFLLAACTPAGKDPAAPGPVPEGGIATPAGAAVAAADLGNGRPSVGYDGPMVRRRLVIAVHPAEGADIAALRRTLMAAGSLRSLALEAIQPTVLEQAVLDHLVPELIVALPESTTRAAAEALADAAFTRGGATPGVEHVHVQQVLVHELRFTVRSAEPEALAAAIDREGILSDALGNYGKDVARDGLAIDYTGPLLSDAMVESVRHGIARQAHVPDSAVAVSPRTAGGGVDMSTEPLPAQPTSQPTSGGDDHGHPDDDHGGDDHGADNHGDDDHPHDDD